MYQPIWFVFLAGGEAVCVVAGHEVWLPVGPVVTCVLITRVGCQLLSWDSPGSIFHDFRIEQRGVSKIMAPPFHPLDCNIREIPQRLELLTLQVN